MAKSAVELRPNAPNAHLLLAWIARATGAQTQAIMKTERSLQLAPNLLPAHVLLAELYYSRWETVQKPKPNERKSTSSRPNSSVGVQKDLEKFSRVANLSDGIMTSCV